MTARSRRYAEVDAPSAVPDPRGLRDNSGTIPTVPLPESWFEGFRRSYPPLDVAPPDLLSHPAFAQVDEDGQRLTRKVGRWCPHGTLYAVYAH
jgi:hypothetical protein